jgi:hypothetical protein
MKKLVKAGRAGDWAGGGFEDRLFRSLGTGKEFARSCVCEAAQRSAESPLLSLIDWQSVADECGLQTRIAHRQ